MNPHLPRILLAGVGPLPPEQPERLYAPGLRVWGMARELARAGHAVRLIAAGFGETPPRVRRFDLTPGAGPIVLPEGLERPVGEDAGALAALLAAEAREWGADAAVATTDVMNHALAVAGLDLPLWLDYFGDPMAERQMIALHAGSDGGIDAQWALVAPALARADRLSGCSTDQCAALLGQLAAVGRLGRLVAGERLVHRLAPWVEPLAPEGADPDLPPEPLLRGGDVPVGAILAVQTGGFNTWLDVDSLFGALERAMAAEPRLHFAATGGAIPGHHEGGFERFEALVNSSHFKDRYHLLGWRPLGEVPRLLAEADLAINLDIPCAEGILGTRNRLLDWLAAGVPIVATPGCELAVELADEGFAALAPHGNPEGAARVILSVAGNPGPWRTAARRGRGWLVRERSAAICLRPLLDWAADPKQAPDLQAWREGGAEPPELWRQAAQTDEARAARRREAEKALRLEQKLARMEGSRWVRLALRLRGKDDLDPPAAG